MKELKVKALGYIEVGVSDLEAWRTYAEDVLVVDCEQENDSLLLRIDDDAWRIKVTDSGEDDLTCSGFEVESAAALDEIQSRLESMGIAASNASDTERARRGVDRLLVCKDPDGLRVELYVGNRSVAEPFQSPRNVSGFITKGQGLGHIVLYTSNLRETEAFYMQGLGFLLSDHISMGPPDRKFKITFLHCNQRHHTLALVPVPVPKHLNHIMLQVGTMDDVGLGLDAARAAGVKISMGLGKHTNDRMTSFYSQTPSGFDIEYGYGGVEIDDAVWETTHYNSGSIWGHAPTQD